MLKHLALIADGNRRWAKENDLPYESGYLQGLTKIEECCLPDSDIKRNMQLKMANQVEEVDVMVKKVKIYI